MKLGQIILAFAIAMAVSIGILTMTSNTHHQSIVSDAPNIPNDGEPKPPLQPPVKRSMSRFLADKERNPKAADHCRKDNSVCTANGKNETCCNNKCIDLKYDNNNCGACKKKCLYTQTCCRGECVYLAFDKRHCDKCNFRCKENEYCVYGMCNYA